MFFIFYFIYNYAPVGTLLWIFFIYFFVKMCGARVWPHMLFHTLLASIWIDYSVFFMEFVNYQSNFGQSQKFTYILLSPRGDNIYFLRSRVDGHGQAWRSLYDIGDSISSWCDHGMIMAWSSWKIARSCHGEHVHFYNVDRTLNIQPALFFSNQVHYFLTQIMLNEPSGNYLKDVCLTKMNLFLKISKFRNCQKYWKAKKEWKMVKYELTIVTLELLFKKLLSVYHRRKLFFWNNLRFWISS